MPSKLMDALKLAAVWLKYEGVEGVSANEDMDSIDVYVSEKFNNTVDLLPNEFHGYRVLIIKNM